MVEYFINQEETKIITRDEDGCFESFDKVEFEEEEIVEVPKATKKAKTTPPPPQNSRGKVDRQKVISMLAEGQKPKEIAAKFGVSVQTIYQIKFEMKQEIAAAKPDDERKKDLIRAYGEDRVNKVIDLGMSGKYTLQEIAEDSELAIVAVESICARMEITLP